MRHLLPILLLASACGLAPAPEADSNEELRRSLADAYAKINTIGQAVLALQVENASLHKQLDGLSSSVAQEQKDVRSSVTELADGTCIATRDAASGLPTGKRQHKPISLSSGIGGSPRPTAGSFVIADTDDDGAPDALVLLVDIDDDGADDYVILGGDSDHDGDFFDDEGESFKRRDAAADRVCGSTDHL